MLKSIPNTIRISIGIPAYNEAENIAFLLHAILDQDCANSIGEIIVIADACVDATVEKIQSVRDPRIQLIENTEREGLIANQNKICSLSKGDILILLDADVIPAHETFLSEIIEPLVSDPSIGIVGANVVSAEPRTAFEKMMVVSHDFKISLYENLNNVSNVFLCHGRARAFSRSMYTSIRWPEGCAEDAFSFFFCITAGKKFVYAKRARVLFRSPSTYTDHSKQSIRFIAGRRMMTDYFDKNLVRTEYAIPLTTYVRFSLRSFKQHPWVFCKYLILTSWIRIALYINVTQITNDHSTYEPALSSKKVLYEK